MLLGVDALAADRPLDDLLAAARTAHAAGLDGLWLEETATLPAPLVAAAVVGPAVPDLRMVCAVVGTEGHPLALGESAAVADRATGGRIALAVRAAPGGEERIGEALTLLRVALAARPFRHEGPAWPTPAGRSEGRGAGGPLARLTPGPSQFELPVWGWGAAAAAPARDAGLGHVAEAGETLPAPRGPAVRGRVVALGDVDPAALRRERAAGLDLLAVRCAPADRPRAADLLARTLRPRLELASLPDGLEALWDADGA